MHSRIFLVSKDRDYEIAYDEDICNEMKSADWVQIQDPEDLEKDLDWLKQDYPNLKISNNSFQLSQEEVSAFQRKVIESRKNDIYRILKKEPLTEYNFWEISRTAQPVVGLMFKYEEEVPTSVESFVLDDIDTDRFYIICSYDYHF